MSTSHEIAAIVPCYNEEVAIGQVIADLRAAVPEMAIYVYDNNSSDRTAEVAEAAGAIVRREERRGKGNVVRRAFADIDAEVYVMIDGDDTYDAAALPEMIRALREGPYDHVLGVRTQVDHSTSAYRAGHELGNKGFNWLVGGIFGDEVSDMLSGYRVMSRRFVKSFPAASREFEIETELTVHVMSLRVPQTEVAVGFKDRPDGSESKLRTYHDGFRILNLVMQLVRHERPLFFFGIIGSVLVLVGVILGIPLVVEFAQTGLVPRFPTAILTVAFGVMGALAWAVGLVLDGVLKARRETSRLLYLQYNAPSGARSRAL
ncbi:glycosyl transferase [Microbacterium nanhaiense]|uniref:Glycosyl transferase n=1 Tax=Microbacterium nanhaiense TaxID=1301026 RepID=A0ABQ2N189_9MICO|nr:glycosyltransferase [Microbacterium nanhaiense]GGO63240.1 glycosyl transferase [Microbacterium nanhaiense]